MEENQTATDPTSNVIGFIDEAIARRIAFFLFWEFCLYYDPVFFAKRQFLKEVADAFQEIYNAYVKGKALTAAISMPPRAGKSYISSLFCCWWLAKFPELSVMRNTCTARLYEKFSYDCRAIIQSARFRQVFPHIRLAPDKKNLQGWNLETSKQAGYFGAGVGGTIIGFGANIAMSDDLYPGLEQALSATYQESVHTWKQGTHDSRKEKNCPEIYIGTRWTRNDEIGRALENGVDIVVKIPALVMGDDGKWHTFCDDVKSTEEYEKVKRNTDDLIWNAEYQQEPDEAKGLLFAKANLKFYDPEKTDLSNPDYRHMYVDPADEGADNLSAPCGHLLNDVIYLPNVIFSPDVTEVTGPMIVAELTSKKYNSATIEGNGAGQQFAKQIRTYVNEKYDNCEVRIIKNSTNKETRILVNAAFIRTHMRFRSDYEQIPEYLAFMKQLMAYMKEGGNKHDDAADSLAGLAKWYAEQFSHLW